MAEEVKYALAYCRYSSDLQREESIEAQTRAIKEYAAKHGYVLRHIYADRAVSGTTTDKREQFMALFDDIRNGRYSDISAVLCHKYDRWARNRADSAIYRRELENLGISLISVLENWGDSPESIILQSVIEGYNEYYSKNLQREVMKGLKENALSCRHTGGTPCLGYSVDKESMRLVINEWEAEAVRLIFKRYLEGEGYTSIINELNKKGYRTKRGAEFGKNSLYEILRNEKYTGVFIYNLSASKNSEGKFNRHKFKPEEDVIRIEGGVPQIVSEEDFRKVQEKMKARQRKTASFKAKQEYLLSSRILCGECLAPYAGNSRKASDTHPLYISYRCTKRNGKRKCTNRQIQRDLIEAIVLKKLASRVFDERLLPEIISKYNAYAASKNTDLLSSIQSIKNRISEVDKGIKNIVNVVMTTGSAALADKLKELENDKSDLEQTLLEQERELTQVTVSERDLKQAFKTAKQMLESGTLVNKRAIVERYVKQVTIYNDKIVIEFNVTADYTITEEVQRQ